MKFKGGQGIVMKFYRVERWLFLHHLNLLATIIYHSIQILFGCTIPYSAELGEGVKIAHFHGIVIHHKSKIGKGTILYQNVSLGGRNGKGGPIIGANCTIGAGACILGEIIVGDNVNIGANAVVIDNIPDNCTVVGVPGKIIKRG